MNRQWCLTLLEGVLDGLREEYVAAGSERVSDRLRGFVASPRPVLDGVLDGEDVMGAVGGDEVDHGGEWTSQYPDQHHNGIPYNSKLPKQALTLAEVLVSQGIRTAGFVDNLLAGRTYGLDQGFADLWERTIVILTADHGDALNEHGYIGHLCQVYEDIVHVPLIVRFPKGKGPHGLRVRGFVDLTDLAPTVTEVFGVQGKAGSDRAFRGRSLLRVILGAPGKPAVVSRTAEDQPKYALRHERFKLIYNTARGQSELYDLEADPGERDDLGVRWPVRASLYRQAIERWILEARRGAKAVEEEVALSDEQKEQLKALGYVR